MADQFNAMALLNYSLHTPRGFIIFNEGQETPRIPEEYRARLVKEGVIAGDGGPLDRDKNGEAGGSLPAEPPALSGMNKTELLAEAERVGADVEEGATNAQIREAIEAKRGDAPVD